MNMSATWKAPAEMIERMEAVIEKYHMPRMTNVSVALALTDAKPFSKNRLNLGTVKKFTDFHKIWQKEPADFCITLPMVVWQDVLQDQQREALLDIHLTRIEPVYEPEVVIENGKKKVIKDEFGRVKFTETIKEDKDGNPKWQILPLDLLVTARNVRRFGLWFDDLIELKSAVDIFDAVDSAEPA